MSRLLGLLIADVDDDGGGDGRLGQQPLSSDPAHRCGWRRSMSGLNSRAATSHLLDEVKNCPSREHGRGTFRKFDRTQAKQDDTSSYERQF